MKKRGLLTAIMAALMVCALIAVPASASAIDEITETSTKAFYKQESGGVSIKSFDFNTAINEVQTLFGTPEHETQDAIDGGGSLKVSKAETAYPLHVFSISRNLKTAGTYYISFDVKPSNTSSILVGIAVKEAGGAASDYLTEFAAAVTYTEGIATSMTATTGAAVGGYGAPADKYFNEKITALGNGVFNCYFEFMLDGAESDSTEFTPIFMFKQRASVKDDNYVIWDNVDYGQITPDKYFTVDWDISFDDIQPMGVPWEQQPIWANNGGYEYESDLDVDGYVLKIDVPITTNTEDGDQIGGFVQDDGKSNKLIPSESAGLTYFQFDVLVEDCSFVNFWTSGVWTELQYNAASLTWTTAGTGITGFACVPLDDGGHRVSYYIDFTGNPNMPYTITTKSSGGGVIYIDNLFVSHEDYTPSVAAGGGSLNSSSASDVEITVYDKDKDFVSLAVKGGDTLTSGTDYTYNSESGVLSVDRSVFGFEDVTFVLTTSGGSVEFTVKVIDERTVVSELVASDIITKVYDGTTDADISSVTFEIKDAQNVTVTVDSGEYESADASDSEVIVLDGITLSDNVNYKLAEKVTVVGAITQKTLTVSDSVVTKTKVYDGTVAAQAQAGELAGVIGDEELTVIATAEYNSANVAEANKITVSYTLEGDGAGNYTVASEEVTDGVAITKKEITVTANIAIKAVGASDPELTYLAEGLVGDDSLGGALSREEGEEIGEYDITIGTLTAGDNYEINFVSASFTIADAADVPVAPDPENPEKPSETQEGEECGGCDSSLGGVSAGLIAAALIAAAAVISVRGKKKSDEK